MKIRGIFRELLKKIIHQAENLSGFLFTFNLRPIYAEKVKMKHTVFSQTPLCAIVIQGPILHKKNFTRETLKIYRKNFPDAILILSTWENENTEYLEEIKNIGVEIVFNKKPAYSGMANFNFQVVSSFSGINKAKNLGAEYVMKTRSDQRFYSPLTLEFLCNIEKKFQIPAGFKQKQRIISIGLDTFRHHMHEISDMLVFGQIDDMLIYWGVPLELPEYATKITEENDKAAAGKRLKIREGEFPTCEKKLSSNFLETVGRPLIWTYEDSYKTMANHFCIVDADDIDLYWHKYARLHERRHYYYNQEYFWDKHEVSFAEWLNIYSAFKK